jgi:hypothetical protein
MKYAYKIEEMTRNLLYEEDRDEVSQLINIKLSAMHESLSNYRRL